MSKKAKYVLLFEPSRVTAWSDTQIKAWEQRKQDPGSYLYYFTVCGAKRIGPFLKEESQSLIIALKEIVQLTICKHHWGLIANTISGAFRTGEQCRQEALRLAGTGNKTARQVFNFTPGQVASIATRTEVESNQHWIKKQTTVARAALGTKSAIRKANAVSRCLKVKENKENVRGLQQSVPRTFRTIQKQLLGKGFVQNFPTETSVELENETEEELSFGDLDLSSSESEGPIASATPEKRIAIPKKRAVQKDHDPSKGSHSLSDSDDDVPIALLANLRPNKSSANDPRHRALEVSEEDDVPFDEAVDEESDWGYSSEDSETSKRRKTNSAENQQSATVGVVRELKKRNYAMIFSDDSEDEERNEVSKRITRPAEVTQANESRNGEQRQVKEAPGIVVNEMRQSDDGGDEHSDSFPQSEKNYSGDSSDEEFLNGWDDDRAEFPHSMTREEFNAIMKQSPATSCKSITNNIALARQSLSEIENQVTTFGTNLTKFTQVKQRLKSLAAEKLDHIRVLLTRLEKAGIDDAKLMMFDTSYQELDERFHSCMKMVKASIEQLSRPQEGDQSDTSSQFDSHDEYCTAESQHQGHVGRSIEYSFAGEGGNNSESEQLPTNAFGSDKPQASKKRKRLHQRREQDWVADSVDDDSTLSRVDVDLTQLDNKDESSRVTGSGKERGGGATQGRREWKSSRNRHGDSYRTQSSSSNAPTSSTLSQLVSRFESRTQIKKSLLREGRANTHSKLPGISTMKSNIEQIERRIKDMRHGTINVTSRRVLPMRDQIQQLLSTVDSVLNKLKFARDENAIQLRKTIVKYQASLEAANATLNQLEGRATRENSQLQNQTHFQLTKETNHDQTRWHDMDETSQDDHYWGEEVSSHALNQLRHHPNVSRRSVSTSGVSKASSSTSVPQDQQNRDPGLDMLLDEMENQDDADNEELVSPLFRGNMWMRFTESIYSPSVVLDASFTEKTDQASPSPWSCVAPRTQVRRDFWTIEQFCTRVDESSSNIFEGLRSVGIAADSSAPVEYQEAFETELCGFLVNNQVSSLAFGGSNSVSPEEKRELLRRRVVVHSVLLRTQSRNPKCSVGLKQYCVMLLHDLFVEAAGGISKNGTLRSSAILSGDTSHLLCQIMKGLDNQCGPGTTFWSTFTLLVNNFRCMCPTHSLSSNERYSLLKAKTSEVLWSIVTAKHNGAEVQEEEMIKFADLVWFQTFHMLHIWRKLPRNEQIQEYEAFDWELFSLLLRTSPLLSPRFTKFSLMWNAVLRTGDVPESSKHQRQVIGYCSEILNRSLKLCCQLSPSISSITELWHGLFKLVNQIPSTPNNSDGHMVDTAEEKFWEKVLHVDDEKMKSTEVPVPGSSTSCHTPPTDEIMLQFLHLVKTQMLRVPKGPKSKRLTGKLLELIPKDQVKVVCSIVAISDHLQQPSQPSKGAKENKSIRTYSSLKLVMSLLCIIAKYTPQSQVQKVAQVAPKIIDIQNSDLYAQLSLARASGLFCNLFQRKGIRIVTSTPSTSAVPDNPFGRAVLPGDVLVALFIATCNDMKGGFDALARSEKDLEQLRESKRGLASSALLRPGQRKGGEKQLFKSSFLSNIESSREQRLQRQVQMLSRLQKERRSLVQRILKMTISFVNKSLEGDGAKGFENGELETTVPMINAVLGSARVQKAFPELVVATLHLIDSVLSSYFPLPVPGTPESWPLDLFTSASYVAAPRSQSTPKAKAARPSEAKADDLDDGFF